MGSDLLDLGVIHGRFQVLHNDHLKYLLAGKRLCRHLVVGITNPDPVLTTDVQADTKRSDPLANPLTYFERLIMVREALLEAGISMEEMTITPLPITRPELYKYYVPMDAVFFLSIYDQWGRKKLDQFRNIGLSTHVLWEVEPEEKGLSSSHVRQLMIEGGEWESLLPRAVLRLCRAWDIPARLGNMT
ncbi:MAG: nicotinate-nucleotide adenylyltransferase [Desulfonatronovibrio sp.]